MVYFSSQACTPWLRKQHVLSCQAVQPTLRLSTSGMLLFSEMRLLVRLWPLQSRMYLIVEATLFIALQPPLTLRWSTEGTSSFILNGEQLFNTGISGLALRVTNRPYGANGYSGNFPRDYTYGGCTANVPTTWRRYCGVSWGAGVQFDLVKVSHPTGSGALAIPGRFRASIVNETFVYSYNVSSSNVSTVACSVTNTSINVPMGNVQRSTFTGVGHEGNPVQFFIPLDCDAATRVNFKIDATADSSGVPGVMAINSSATGNAASGVGIKITRSGAPVAFGTVIPVGTVANAGMFNIPLIAQYYQTLPNVTAGQANGTATFTMTYN